MLQLIFRLSTIEFKLKGTGKNITLQIKNTFHASNNTHQIQPDICCEKLIFFVLFRDRIGY